MTKLPVYSSAAFLFVICSFFPINANTGHKTQHNMVAHNATTTLQSGREGAGNKPGGLGIMASSLGQLSAAFSVLFAQLLISRKHIFNTTNIHHELLSPDNSGSGWENILLAQN